MNFIWVACLAVIGDRIDVGEVHILEAIFTLEVILYYNTNREIASSYPSSYGYCFSSIVPVSLKAKLLSSLMTTVPVGCVSTVIVLGDWANEECVDLFRLSLYVYRWC